MSLPGQLHLALLDLPLQTLKTHQLARPEMAGHTLDDVGIDVM